MWGLKKPYKVGYRVGPQELIEVVIDRYRFGPEIVIEKGRLGPQEVID